MPIQGLTTVYDYTRRIETLVNAAPSVDSNELRALLPELVKHIDDLDRDSRKLEALEQGGVDNWDWYSASLEPFWEEEEIIEKERQASTPT